MVQVDVVGGSVPGIEADCPTYDKRNRLGFRLPDRLGSRDATLGLVQHLVGEFMDKRAELLGCALTGEDGDAATVAHPQSWRDALFELKPDALGSNEVEQPFPVLSHIVAGDFV